MRSYTRFRREVNDPGDEIGDLISEHDNLARLLTDLAMAIRNRNFDHFETSLQPLYQAMLKHNSHEETVLGRMRSESLLNCKDEILHEMEKIDPRLTRAWEF